MIIHLSPYALAARADGRRRQGTLLRVAFNDGARGYADLHPWPELGDEPLDDQLAALAQGTPYSLAARSLDLARADAEARAEGRSLFEGLTIPPSHASLPFGLTPGALERAVKEGYSRVKLKGIDFSATDLALFRASGLRFRLDFNARPAFETVCRTLDVWGDLAWIDWLEDPCPYRLGHWSALRERFGVRLALDFERGGEAFDIRIIKPARDAPPHHPPSTIHHPPKFAFTSYLDHPVGQLGAAWVAARAVADGLSVEPGGLVTHEVYEPNAFSEGLGVQDARLVPPDGPGLGFARELDALDWKALDA